MSVDRSTTSVPATDSPAQTLLARLQGVRQKGPGRWVACCPAHEDKGPSLAVTEQPDSRVLIHDFAGCSVHEILSAVGLNASDLFPRRLGQEQFRRMERRAFDPAQRLACVAHEATVVAIIAERCAKQGVVTEDDRACLLLAASRIVGAVPR